MVAAGKVRDNTITTLPASFEKLKKLRVLMIGGLNLDEESLKLLGRMQEAIHYCRSCAQVGRGKGASKTLSPYERSCARGCVLTLLSMLIVSVLFVIISIAASTSPGLPR